MISIPIPSDLKLRFLSAAILAPFVIFAIYSGGIAYQIMIVLSAVIMSFEWNNIISCQKNIQLNIKQRNKWDILGIIYIVIPSISLLYIRDMEDGLELSILLFVTVWAVDIFAYFAGKYIGGPKIIPSISPNKTWAGLAGGMLGAVITNIIFCLITGGITIISSIIIGVLSAVIAQSGDFFESWVKRHFGVKDSGSTIPGHGGLLDRVDGLIALAPFMLIILYIMGY